jgi:hypothetical protein
MFFPDMYCPVILEAGPMPYLIAGLGCDSDSARYECRRTLADLAGHGLFMCCICSKMREFKFIYIGDDLETILHDDIVPPLVEMLDSEDIHKRAGGVCGLYFITRHGKYIPGWMTYYGLVVEFFRCNFRCHWQNPAIHHSPSHRPSAQRRGRAGISGTCGNAASHQTSKLKPPLVSNISHPPLHIAITEEL